MYDRHCDLDELLAYQQQFLQYTDALLALSAHLQDIANKAEAILQDAPSQKQLEKIRVFSDSLRAGAAQAQEEMQPRLQRTRADLETMRQLDSL